MARPLPDPKEVVRRGKIVEGLVNELGGKSAAVRALEAAQKRAPTADTLYKYINGPLLAPLGLIDDLKALCVERPRWLIASDNKHNQWLIHNHAPGFTARAIDGEIADVRWHSGEAPPARIMGALLQEAAEQLG